MANISFEDVRQMAGPMGLTGHDISSPVRLEIAEGKCNRCGACCKTQNGIVLSLDDVYRIAGHLGVTPKYFFRHFCRESESIYDIFGMGPFKGLLLATKNGVCPFYKDRTGCAINDVKPLTCRLYPFNTLNVTRICLLKMQKMKDGEAYRGCFILDLPGNAIVPPDYEALAVSHIQSFVTREYLAQTGGQWQQSLAHEAKDACVRLSQDEKLVEQYGQMMQVAFADLDKRNAELLAKALE